MPKAKSTRKSPASLFDFKVLIEPSKEHGGFVAYCLQTGSVATADDAETVESIIGEVLQSEVIHAMETENLRNLYSSPAPPEVWFRWLKVAQTKPPKTRVLTLALKQPATPKKPPQGVQGKVEVARFA